MWQRSQSLSIRVRSTTNLPSNERAPQTNCTWLGCEKAWAGFFLRQHNVGKWHKKSARSRYMNFGHRMRQFWIVSVHFFAYLLWTSKKRLINGSSAPAQNWHRRPSSHFPQHNSEKQEQNIKHKNTVGRQKMAPVIGSEKGGWVPSWQGSCLQEWFF